jgi:hypothetical protein
MGRRAIIYLAHMNPLTKAHQTIISSFLKKDYGIYIFPVRFLKGGKEINTRSFPFPYKIRKAMVESVFSHNNKISILPDYTFFYPFIKYLPPLISPYSWVLRNQIVRNIKENDFVAYTGDKIESIALKLYKLHPNKFKRLEISASNVKEMLYLQAIKGTVNEAEAWHDKVPEEVASLINENWKIIEKYARSPDYTMRLMGMKFPKEGLF